MVIQHNLSAMNADRMNGIVNINVGKSAEKLSSGYRINRASDDAAGLAMSEKMRRQVRGLRRLLSMPRMGSPWFRQLKVRSMKCMTCFRE